MYAKQGSTTFNIVMCLWQTIPPPPLGQWQWLEGMEEPGGEGVALMQPPTMAIYTPRLMCREEQVWVSVCAMRRCPASPSLFEAAPEATPSPRGFLDQLP